MQLQLFYKFPPSPQHLTFKMSEPAAKVIEEYTFKVLYILDCTASMQNNIDAIKNSIQQVFCIKGLCGSNIAIQFVLFRDYSIDLCDWTIKITPVMNDFQEVMDFISGVDTKQNSDTPEACKTALVRALDFIDDDTIVLVLTDAPPHEDITLENLRRNNQKYKDSTWNDIMMAFMELSIHLNKTYHLIPINKRQYVSNGILEALALGPYYSIWMNIVNHPKYKMLRDNNKIYIFSNTRNITMVNYYSALGTYINMKQTSSNAITNITIGVFLNLIGVPFSQDITVLSTFEVIKNLFGNIEIGNFALVKNLYPFPCIEAIRCNIKDIIIKFRGDDTFKNLVFLILEKLITPQNVMSLTTNDIFGKLWRECCKQRENPILAKLQNAISICCSSSNLGGDYTAPAKLKKWIADSYDDTKGILKFFQESIAKFHDDKRGRYIQMLVSDLPQMSRDDILEIGRGTATFESLRKIVHFLINSRVMHYYSNSADVNHPDDVNIANKITTLPQHFMPMCIPLNKFFKYLGHLMCSGTLFSMKSACILAILAYQSENPIFLNRAERFLHRMIGQWLAIDKITDFPELLSVSFIKLLEKVPWALTVAEQKYFKKYQDFTRLRSVQNLDVDTQISWVPSKGSIYSTEKWLCNGCNNMRPLSLMAQFGICVFCNDLDMTQKSKEGDYNNECSDEKSYLVMCKNERCRGIYAVQQIKKLQCTPKCHYCRNQLPISNVECQTCHNQFVVPDQIMISDQLTNYKCSMCTKCPEQTIIDKTITLGTLINENPIMKPLFGVASDVDINMQGSLFKNRDAIPDCHEPSPVPAPVPAPPTTQITVNRRYVHNASAICSSLPTQIINGEHTTANCAICYGDFHISKLGQLCGNCNNKVCHDCGVQWYSSISNGNIVQPAHLCCAFCKKRPQYNIIMSFNLNISNLMGTRKTIFDIHYYYGWCRLCNQIKIAGDVACGAAEADPDFAGRFECEDCRIEITNAQPNIDVKMCPNPDCGIATEKTSGCNHITCGNCRTHWCYVCQDIFPYNQLHTGSPTDIYRHMNEAHGGWGFGNDYNDDDAGSDDDN